MSVLTKEQVQALRGYLKTHHLAMEDNNNLFDTIDALQLEIAALKEEMDRRYECGELKAEIAGLRESLAFTVGYIDHLMKVNPSATTTSILRSIALAQKRLGGKE